MYTCDKLSNTQTIQTHYRTRPFGYKIIMRREKKDRRSTVTVNRVWLRLYISKQIQSKYCTIYIFGFLQSLVVQIWISVFSEKRTFKNIMTFITYFISITYYISTCSAVNILSKPTTYFCKWSEQLCVYLLSGECPNWCDADCIVSFVNALIRWV